MKALVNGTWTAVSGLKFFHNNTWTSRVAPSVLQKHMDKAFFLDCGRKYFTVDAVKEMIDYLSENGYNALFLHFSEDMGCRIESKLYPWLAGSDDDLCVVQGITDTDEGKFWTQAQVAEIVGYASDNDIEVIPSFDSPAHMNYIVKKYNEHENTDIGNYFHYNNQTALVQGSGNTSYSRGIDISNTEARIFAKSLIREYADLFYRLGCRRFDIGGDELLGWGSAVVSTNTASRWRQLDHWKAAAIAATGNSNAVAYDYFLMWLNELHSMLIRIGYEEVFCWNDQILRTYDTGWNRVTELNSEISILYWTATANNSLNSPLTYMQAGHSVYNFVDAYNYYVLKSGYTNPTVQTVSAWTVENFNGYTASQYEGKVKGSAFCLWCDNPAYMSAEDAWSAVTTLLDNRLL